MSGAGSGGKAGVAQLVEHLICNQRVGGSNPFRQLHIRTGFRKRKQKILKKHVIGWRLVWFFAGFRLRRLAVLRGDPTEVHAPKCRRLSG